MSARIDLAKQLRYGIAVDLIPTDHLRIGHCYSHSEHRTLCGIKWENVLILRDGNINCPKCIKELVELERHT